MIDDEEPNLFREVEPTIVFLGEVSTTHSEMHTCRVTLVYDEQSGAREEGWEVDEDCLMAIAEVKTGVDALGADRWEPAGEDSKVRETCILEAAVIALWNKKPVPKPMGIREQLQARIKGLEAYYSDAGDRRDSDSCDEYAEQIKILQTVLEAL